MEDFLATVLRVRRHGRGHWGAVTPKFAVLKQICCKHTMKTKNFSPKNLFFPQTLKPGYGLIRPKLCLQLRYLVLKIIWPRDAA